MDRPPMPTSLSHLSNALQQVTRGGDAYRSVSAYSKRPKNEEDNSLMRGTG